MSNRNVTGPSVSQVSEIAIALVRKTQGRHGEVAAEILTDFPDRFQSVKRARLVKPDGTNEWRNIENFWFHKRAVILKFSGMESLSQAKEWVGAEVRIPRSEAVPLSGDSYYLFDLIGCQLIDDENGRPLGKVRDWLGTSEHGLLSVELQGRELLVPFASEFCRGIDIEHREIRVRLPEGLMDLNP